MESRVPNRRSYWSHKINASGKKGDTFPGGISDKKLEYNRVKKIRFQKENRICFKGEKKIGKK